jgi:SsrA-binding protein
VAKAADDDVRVIADNRKARHDYEIFERFEAGIQLFGSEVKSIRAGKVQVAGAHVRVIGNEAWLVGMHIAEYAFSHQFNHELERHRKLLLHRREVDKLSAELRQNGLAAPLLRVYFRGRNIKVEFGLGRGRKAHDKRQALKTHDAQREIARHHRG